MFQQERPGGSESDSRRVAEALKIAGVPVTSVYDLVNSRESCPEAIPVLLALLREGIADDGVLEGVVRALAVPEARGAAARPLIQLFEDLPETKDMVKWAIGNRLSVVATSDNVGDLLRLALDPKHGGTRQMIVWALGRCRSPEVTNALIKLLSEPEVAAHAVHALGNQRAKEAIPFIEDQLANGTPLFRKEARRALDKLRELP